MPECLVRVFKVGTPRAVLECSLYYDAETLMLLYGFIAGGGALSAAREDYVKAFCWLWNIKCLECTGECVVSLLKDDKSGILEIV